MVITNFGDHPMKNFDQLLNLIKDKPVRTIAVGAADDHTVIEAAYLAQKDNIARTILIGRKDGIIEKAQKINLKLDDQDVIDEPDNILAAAKAVALTADGQADIVMKGQIHTDDFLRAVLDKECGLRAGVIMSHVFVVEWKETGKLIFITLRDRSGTIQTGLSKKLLGEQWELAKLLELGLQWTA